MIYGYIGDRLSRTLRWWSHAISDIPTLYYRYIGRVYRIRVLSDAVEVARLKTGTSPAARSLSFEIVPGLRTTIGWRRSVAESLIDRYEAQLAAESE